MEMTVMRRIYTALAAMIVTLGLSSTANAQQFNRNIIRDSGNGINNAIIVRNGGAGPQFGFPGQGGFNTNRIVNSGNGINNTIGVNNGGGGFPGGGFPGGGFPGGGFPGGGFPGGGYPGQGGVNVNVITNSGNGAGNTIFTNNRGNGGPNSININVITNSGNGINNTIGVRNR